MTNELKDRILRDWKLHFRSQPKKVFIEMLDQFEGYKLVDEDRIDLGCDRCNVVLCEGGCYVRQVHLYHDTKTNKNEWLCKSCFDKQCPEPAPKPAEPDYICHVCQAKCDANLYVYAGWGICRECALKVGEWDKAKPDHIADAGKMIPEPEPWAEFKEACKKKHIRVYEDVEEAWWKEQERRVNKMIAAAIAAHNKRLVDALRYAAKYMDGTNQQLVAVLSVMADALEKGEV